MKKLISWLTQAQLSPPFTNPSNIKLQLIATVAIPKSVVTEPS
jgi:hypothetical protein